MLIAPTMDSIEFAWDDAKYGDYSQDPVMDMIVPTLFNPSMAPEGKHILSANIMYIPYQKKGGWSEEDKNELTEKIIDTISQYSPNIRDNILHSELLTPLDIEKEFNLTGGHWHHGELALDQMLMMRPTYEAAQYRTPIDKLYLCSAGCHPGGGIMGAAGYNAAKEIIK
jgi:phytoene dehydrogenase-like protein